MAKLRQFLSQFTHALARPTQCRLRVSTRHRLHQPFQVLLQTWVFAHGGFAPASFATNPPSLGSFLVLHFFDTVTDGFARQARGPRNGRDPSSAYRQCFAGCKNSACSFIEFSPYLLKSLLD